MCGPQSIGVGDGESHASAIPLEMTPAAVKKTGGRPGALSDTVSARVPQ